MAILFSDLCLLFERIAAIKPTRAGQHDATAASKTLIVFKQWLSALTDASTRDGIVLFRLIFPDHDIRRRYGLKETLLARELRKALSFSSNALACWRDGNSEASVVYEDIDSVKRKAGCFGHHLEAVLAPRRDFTMENAPSIDIQRLDALLDELASHCEYSCNEVRQLAYDRQKHRFRSCILFDLFSPLSAKESAYLAQIILRDLTPLLYPLPTCIAEAALSKFNSSSYQELSLTEALREWHWLLPIVYRYRADIGQAFAVVDSQKIDRSKRSLNLLVRFLTNMHRTRIYPSREARDYADNRAAHCRNPHRSKYRPEWLSHQLIMSIRYQKRSKAVDAGPSHLVANLPARST